MIVGVTFAARLLFCCVVLPAVGAAYLRFNLYHHDYERYNTAETVRLDCFPCTIAHAAGRFRADLDPSL